MASGTGGYNAAAYGDNGWNDAALITESGIAGTGSTGTVKLWSLIDTTDGGDETWTTGVAN